jgi:hypothetical protein
MNAMATSVLQAPPTRIHRPDVAVMEQTTADELPEIQKLWPSFERLVGLRGRKMYGRADVKANTYTACTPVRDGDRPEEFGLRTGVLRGGWYLRGNLTGESPAIFEKIGPGMAELEGAEPVDHARPLVEFYRRHDVIELWVPVFPA